MTGDHPQPLPVLIGDLALSFEQAAEHKSGIEFPADLTALWGEALRGLAEDVRALQIELKQVTAQRDALQRKALAADIVDFAATGAPRPAPVTGFEDERVIDVRELFAREQAMRRRPAVVDCQGEQQPGGAA